MKIDNNKYFWTSGYNTGVFYYWKAKDYNDLEKQANKLYGDNLYDFGITLINNYNNGRKFLGDIDIIPDNHIKSEKYDIKTSLSKIKDKTYKDNKPKRKRRTKAEMLKVKAVKVNKIDKPKRKRRTKAEMLKVKAVKVNKIDKPKRKRRTKAEMINYRAGLNK